MGMPGAGRDSYAINQTNWCQAYAYCAWAGKELCGALDGGAFDYGAFADSTQSVWMSACSANGAQQYPYGASFKPSACDLSAPDGAIASLAPVGSFGDCVGSLPGLYDMLGNVGEWENACQSSDGGAAADLCRRGGGGFDDIAGATCAFSDNGARNHQSGTTGFRCCAMLP